MSGLIALQKRIAWAIRHFEEIFLGAALLAAVLFTFSAVIFRYVLLWSVPWTDESALHTMILLLFIGAAAAARQKIHIRVEVLSSFVRGKLARDTINLGIDLVGFMCCCFCLWLLYSPAYCFL